MKKEKRNRLFGFAALLLLPLFAGLFAWLAGEPIILGRTGLYPAAILFAIGYMAIVFVSFVAALAAEYFLVFAEKHGFSWKMLIPYGGYFLLAGGIFAVLYGTLPLSAAGAVPALLFFGGCALDAGIVFLLRGTFGLTNLLLAKCLRKNGKERPYEDRITHG